MPVDVSREKMRGKEKVYAGGVYPTLFPNSRADLIVLAVLGTPHFCSWRTEYVKRGKLGFRGDEIEEGYLYTK